MRAFFPIIFLIALLAWSTAPGQGYAASLSGVVACDLCSPSPRMIRIIAADGPDPCTASTAGETTLLAPGEYVLNDLPSGVDLWLWAYRDEDGNGTWSSGDIIGSYNDHNSFRISGVDNPDHDLDLSWSPEPAVTAMMQNVHEPPGGSFSTWLEVLVHDSFKACFPDDVESIVVEGPEGILPYGKNDFTHAPQWSAFYLNAPGSPAVGQYTVTVTARGASASDAVTLDALATIPIPDKDSFVIDGRTVSWDLVEYADAPLYYRVDIAHRGERVHSGEYEPNMTSYTIPDGILTPGQVYAMRVRATDDPMWDAARNSAYSEWVPFTYGAEISYMFVQHLQTESGESHGRLFFMIKGTDNRYLASGEGVAVRLYDPNGRETDLPPYTFSSLESMVLGYNDGSTDWSASTPFENITGFEAEISEPLIPGTWLLEVDLDDRTLRRTFDFNGLEILPIVSSSTFRLMETETEDVIWTWDPPDPCMDSSPWLDGSETSARAVIEIYRDDRVQGEVSIAVPTCWDYVYLPARLVGILNAMGARFVLTVQVRTDDENNRSSSDPLTLDAIGEHDPWLTLIWGRIADETTGLGVAGARIELEPGGFLLTTDADGVFESDEIPPGSYHVTISAEGYFPQTFPDVHIHEGVNSRFPTLLSIKAPEIDASNEIWAVIEEEGPISALLTATITHPDGLDHISSVIMDLSDFGGPADQAMYDNETNGDAISADGAYSFLATISEETPIGSHLLKMTATDDQGHVSHEWIELAVAARHLGAVEPTQSDSGTFVNEIEFQTITISFTRTPSEAEAGSRRNGDDCYVELTIYTPDDEVHGVYQVQDSLDITIDGAETGTWRFETENKCDTPVNYQIQTQGGGTGVISGRVLNAYTGAGVIGAGLTCDTGGGALSLSEGYFAGVVAAGVGAVTTIASDYKVNIKTGVVITAGETTELTIPLISEAPPPPQPPPATAKTTVLMDPSGEPNPIFQPFAAKTSDGFLTLDALFPAYQQAMNLHLAMVVDYPGLSGVVYLFDSDNAITDLSKGLAAWRAGVTDGQSGQVLPSTPLDSLPPADYTFASMAVPASGTPAGFDLIYYTIPLGLPPPTAPSNTHLPSPLETPEPVVQPLAARISGDNLLLDAWYPPWLEPVTIFVAWQSPGPSGALHTLNSNDEWIVFSGALTPWRDKVKTKQAGTLLNRPLSELPPGSHTFYSIVTTDPAGFSKYSLISFTKTIGSG